MPLIFSFSNKPYFLYNNKIIQKNQQLSVNRITKRLLYNKSVELISHNFLNAKYIYIMKKCETFKVLLFKKKNIILAFLVIFFAISLAFLPKIISSSSPKTRYTVVIDAGHGGIDGGSVGKSGICEAVINLSYAKCLKEYLVDFGFNVVMTRSTDDGLYSPFAKNKKKDDMKKRKEIIENSGTDFVVSIHMNSYDSSSQGAEIFYGENDEPSRNLALNIQKYFSKYLKNARQEIKVGDYYILNAIKAPSVLVECGYLSNPQEEALLLTEDYKKEVCYSILLGILGYLD